MLDKEVFPGIGVTQCYVCQDRPQECKELSQLSESDCQSKCANDSKKECVLGKKTKEGASCFVCHDKPQPCSDFNELSDEECKACAQDPKKECVAGKKAASLC